MSVGGILEGPHRSPRTTAHRRERREPAFRSDLRDQDGHPPTELAYSRPVPPLLGTDGLPGREHRYLSSPTCSSQSSMHWAQMSPQFPIGWGNGSSSEAPKVNLSAPRPVCAAHGLIS